MPVAAIVAIAIVLALVIIGVVLMRRRSGLSRTSGTPSPVAEAATVSAEPLRQRLNKTRRALGDRLNGMLRRGALDDTFWNELEESLIAADMGVPAATQVAAGVKARRPETGEEARKALCDELLALLGDKDRSLNTGGTPAVILVVGVNGSGKTTTIAKLASILKDDGRSVILGSADTFRAAADTQLRTWAGRIGVPVVGGGGATDPASVAYDAYQAAQARRSDVLIVDTAGRLQAKTNLMDEIAKVARILRREAGDIDEVLLVVDGTSGQNALSQARAFTEAVGVTGLVITKLDGSARGGVVVAVEQELGIPMKYIGVGEGIGHLVEFDPVSYVDALVGE
jgi:fused signal recognition particle receptor